MTGEPTVKSLSSQFNKLGVISQAEFENQRSEKMDNVKERHDVADEVPHEVTDKGRHGVTDEDDLQFELDENANTVAKDTIDSTPINEVNRSMPVTSPKHIDNSCNQRERESLYWLDNSARFYPVPIRPHPNIVKPIKKVC